MIDKNVLQAGCSAQSSSPIAKMRPGTSVTNSTTAFAKNIKHAKAKRLTLALLPAALILLAVAPLNAQAQTCATAYQPGTQVQRLSSGLFDGRVGPIKIVNNTETATVISLYHPDAPERVFKYWYAEPGNSYLLGTDNYSSDWGIQVDEGPICIVGRVASWDGRTFTTFPSRLFVVDTASAETQMGEALPGAGSNAPKSAAAVALLPRPETPSVYESIALQQLTKGEVRSGLISLLRAADLYRANGQSQEEKRVRDRIKQIRGS